MKTGAVNMWLYFSRKVLWHLTFMQSLTSTDDSNYINHNPTSIVNSNDVESCCCNRARSDDRTRKLHGFKAANDTCVSFEIDVQVQPWRMHGSHSQNGDPSPSLPILGMIMFSWMLIVSRTLDRQASIQQVLCLLASDGSSTRVSHQLRWKRQSVQGLLIIQGASIQDATCSRHALSSATPI